MMSSCPGGAHVQEKTKAAQSCFMFDTAIVLARVISPQKQKQQSPY